MRINGVEIEDTFAEAFEMWGARVVVTACTQHWALTAAQAATGFATSIIGCGCEAGTNDLPADEQTPDGRPGVAALFFTTSRQSMEVQLLQRVGQGVMTSPTSACYNGLTTGERVKVGASCGTSGTAFRAASGWKVDGSGGCRRVHRRGELWCGQGCRRWQLLHPG